MQTDVSILSGYAEGYDGGQFVVFGMGGAGSTEVSQAASEMLRPLASYGFTISS